jgi:hypothetical protein
MTDQPNTMAANDIDDLTPEEKEIQGRRAKVGNPSWFDIPSGYYAVPITRDVAPYVIGWSVYQRKEPRTFKNGRTVGRDQWVAGCSLLDWGWRSNTPAEGITRQELDSWIQARRQESDQTGYMFWNDWREADIAFVLADVDQAQAQFGKLFGRCGICGKKLTDPDSLIRGIGPDCAGLRR